MSLATTNSVPARIEPRGSPASSQALTLNEVWQMAEYVAASRLFPVQNPEQAFTLMMICQAEGIHPIQALRRYHIIQGRPVMRSDAVQGEMQARGWKIRPVKRDAKEARAVFAHPNHCPEGFEFGVTLDQYKFLSTKDNWKNHPDDMLWARLMTKAARTLDPGIIAGIYSPEEVEDMDALASPAVALARLDDEAGRKIAEVDLILPGQGGSAVDIRPYSAAATDAARAVGYEPAELHRHLMRRAVREEKHPGPLPTRVGDAVKALTDLYARERGWVRREVIEFCKLRDEVQGEPEPVAAEDVSQETDPEFDYEPGGEG